MRRKLKRHFINSWCLRFSVIDQLKRTMGFEENACGGRGEGPAQGRVPLGEEEALGTPEPEGYPLWLRNFVATAPGL